MTNDNKDVQAHSAGGEDDSAPCGVQLGLRNSLTDDVIAHSAEQEDDSAPCGVQLGKNL